MNDGRIQALPDARVKSRNRKDREAFAACFSETADYVTGEGVHWSGRAKIRAGMEALVDSGETGGTAVITHRSVRHLGPAPAVAHLTWLLEDSGSPSTSSSLARGGVTGLVLALHEGRWLIEAAQNTDGAAHNITMSP